MGLPDGVVEAVANHHDPGALPGTSLDPVAAVHIADALANELQPPETDSPPAAILDEPFVARLGLGPQQGVRRYLAAQSANRLAAPGRGPAA
jgi:hypothetical protein